MKNRSRRGTIALVVAAMVAILVAVPLLADYVGSLVNRIFLDPASISVVSNGYQAGDVISFILETTPADTGSDNGHAAWMTAYLPAGVRVVGADYVLPAANGGYDTIPAEDTDQTYDGWGSRGNRGWDAESLPNNCEPGPCAVLVDEGYVNEVQQDTGIFFSGDPRTSLVAAGVGVLDPTGVAAQTIYNQWDYDQLSVFGVGGATNGGQGDTPVFSLDNGATWTGVGSIVAGPGTYYTNDYNPACSGSTAFADDIQCVGPWRRIAVPNDKIGAAGAIAPATAAGPIQNTSVAATGGVALDPTSFDCSTDTNCLPAGTNTVRWVHGKRRLGELESARLTFVITDPAAFSASVNNDEFCLDSTGGDTSDTAAKDNPFRYYEPQHECDFFASTAAFIKETKFVNGVPGNGASLTVGDVLSWRVLFINTSGDPNATPPTGETLTNVRISDMPVAGDLLLLEPGDPLCAYPSYDGNRPDGPIYDAGTASTPPATWTSASAPPPGISVPSGQSVEVFMCGVVNSGGVNDRFENEARVLYDSSTGSDIELISKAGGTVSNSISGHVYNDLDLNGTLTAGDSGVGGVQIDLYLDDGTTPGVLDGGDTLVDTKFTLSDGSYEFAGLAADDYLVVETDLSGWTSTGDKDDLGGPCPGGGNGCNTIGAITTGGGGASTLNDFFDQAPASALNVIEGLVFFDNNVNATFDAGDRESDGVDARLYRDSNGNGLVDLGEPLLQTVTSAADGTFSFTLTETGNFAVDVDPATFPLGASLTTGNGSGEGITFVGFGNTSTGHDFGLFGGVGTTGGICYAVADSVDQLVAVDYTGGGPPVFVDIGPTGTTTMEAMAIQPGTLRFFGATATQLGTMNPNTGAFTPVGGAYGTCVLPGGAPSTINDVDGLSFDPFTGILWASERDGADDLLLQLDPDDGTVVANAFGGGVSCLRIPTSGAPGGRVDLDDIAIDPSFVTLGGLPRGEMYAISNSGGVQDRLIRINKTTGAVTDVGLLGVGDMEGLGFDNVGILYGTTGGGASLYTIPKIAPPTPTFQFAFPSYGDYEAVDCQTAGSNFIRGTVFVDFDQDGVFEPATGEQGTGGVSVRLYIDNNNDGLVDGGDTLIQTLPTNPDGSYEFPVATTGNYVVDTLYPGSYPSGAVLTTDNVEEADFVDFNQVDAGNDFGFTAPSDLAITKTSDAVGEVVPGQTIEYTVTVANSGTVTQTGIQVFDPLPAGTGYVAESTTAIGVAAGTPVQVAQADFEEGCNGDDTYPFETGVWVGSWTEIGETTDCDSNDVRIRGDGGTEAVRIDNDNGIYRDVDLSASFTAFLDLQFRRDNFNSADDISRVAVCDVTMSTCTPTAATGTAGWVLLEQIQGPTNDAVYQSRSYDITAFRSTQTRIRVLNAPTTNRDIYFDNFVVRGSTLTATTLDNDPGTAGIAPLADGDPSDLVLPADGFILEPASSMTVTFSVTVDDPLDPYRAAIVNIVTVSSDQAVPAQANVVDPVSPLGTVGDRVWHDVDGDGVQDIGEPGLANVAVNLRIDDDGTAGPSAGDSVAASRLTGTDGKYRFDHLGPGVYWVDIDDSTVPAGLVHSPNNIDPPTDPIASAPTYTIVTDEVFLDADFGYTSPAGTAVVGDYVWNDMNRNGLQNFGEVGYAGVTLNLVAPGPDGVLGTGDDVIVASTTTAADGSYRFVGVAPGEYRVEITDTGGVLSGASPTSGPQSVGAAISLPLTVAAGDSELGVDFGYTSDACLPRLDFQVDAAGNPVVGGQVIDNEWAAWGLNVGFTINPPSTGPAMIFDSANVTGGDLDLGSPNETCTPPGPGIGAEGEAGQPGENCVSQGNILILSEDGDASDPDDAADGGTITFTFDRDTDIDGISFLDAENARDSVEVLGSVVDNYRDEFTSSVYNNDDGSLDWSGDFWSEEGTDDGTAGGGSITINGGALQLEGSGGNPERRIERDVDLSGFAAASLSFDWDCIGDMEVGQDFVHIEISANGGGAWTTLESKEGEVDMCVEPGDNDGGSEVYDLSSLIDADPSDSRIRFRYTISATAEDFFVDNLEIRSAVFFSNLTAPGDNAFERLPVGVSGARQLVVTFPASGAVASLDFCLGSVRDKVWLDLDGDGLFDSGESGIPGVTVNLLRDPDGIPGNGDELVIGTTTTGAEGGFAFDGLVDGDFVLGITDTSGVLSGLGGTTGPALAGLLGFSITGGDDVVGINFGYDAPGNIGDTVWSDADADGVQGPGEPGIEGVTVQLWRDADGNGVFDNTVDTLVGTEVTNAAGQYLFRGLGTGTFFASVNDGQAALAGYTATTMDEETGGNAPGTQIEVTHVIPYETTLSADFGYRNSALPEVSGTVFEDLDADGFEEPGEPGFPSVTVALVDAGPDGLFGTTDDLVVATTATGSSGDYSFLDVAAGDYQVVVTDQASILDGYSLTSGLDRIPITVAAMNIGDIDFGYIRTSGTASIGDTVWLDLDGNGTQEGGEPGIGNVTVELWLDNGDGVFNGGTDTLVSSQPTDNFGNYRFTGLGPGNYFANVDETTLPGGVPASSLVRTDAMGSGSNSDLINLSEGEYYRLADFGYGSGPGEGAVGDYVWYDADGDGQEDAGEPGIGGVTVRLYDSTSTLIGTTMTAPDGSYLFTGLAPGDYTVQVDTSTLPSFYNPTPTNTPAGRTFLEPPAIAGQITAWADFGFDSALETDESTVGDRVYLDQDGDGVEDSGEPGIAGVQVNLIDDVSGAIIATMTTDQNGNYDFPVPPGTYSVVINDVDAVLDQLNRTTSLAPTQAIPIVAGTNYNAADFGYSPAAALGSIGDKVFTDFDSDGFRDPGEPGIPGVVIDLWLDTNGNGVLEKDGTDNLLRSVITDQNGEYQFQGLPLSEYLVEVNTAKSGVLTGLSQTFGTPGVNDNGQSSPYQVTLVSGSPSNDTADFSYSASLPLQITGNTYFDNNGNGVIDPPTERGIGGVTLLLYRDLDGDGVGDSLIQTTTSDPNGDYVFNNVPGSGDDMNPFRYVVVVDTTGSYLQGGLQTQPTVGNQKPALGTMDSNNNDFGFTFAATLVLISDLRSYDDGGNVVVELETASQLGTIGFWLWRFDDELEEYVQVNQDILPATPSPVGAVYRFVDEGASSTSNRYVVYEAEMRGGELVYGPFDVAVEEAGPRLGGRSLQITERAPSEAQRLRLREADIEARSHFENSFSRIVVENEAKKASAVKVYTARAGIQMVTAGQIAQSLGGKLSKIQKSIGSGKMLVEHFSDRGWAEIAWTAAPDDSGIHFYAEAADSVFTDLNVYRVRADKGETMATESGGSPAPSVSASGFSSQVRFEQQVFAGIIASTSADVDFWYWESLIAGDPTWGTKSVEIDVHDPIGGFSAELGVRLYGASNSSSEADHRVEIAINGFGLGAATWDGLAFHEPTFAIPAGVLRAGANTVTLTAELSTGVPFSYSYLDRLELSYQRQYRADEDRLELVAPDRAIITVAGFSSPAIAVYELGGASEDRPPRRLLRTTIDSKDGYRVSFVPAGPGVRYEVVATPGLAVTATEPWIELETKKLSKGADYLVIAPDSLFEGAERLADYRDSKDLRTMVVGLEGLYNLYGGLRTPEAVRRFVRDSRDWKTEPNYLVVVGKGNYDYNDYLGLGGNLLPPLLAATPVGLYAADGLFGDVEGEDGIPELAVGRIPVLTALELDAYLDKLIAHEEQRGAPSRDRIVLLADDADRGGNFAASSEAVRTLIPSSYQQQRIYLDLVPATQAREDLFSALEEGAFLVNYFGHGGLDRLTDQGLLTVDDVPQLGTSDGLPIFASMTCLVGAFEIPGYSSLAETLVLAEGRGALAVFGPSGTSINVEAEVLNGLFLSALFAPETRRVGDAALEAVRLHAAESLLPSLSQVYNLLGDPGLRVSASN